jgi:hypothetical protein
VKRDLRLAALMIRPLIHAISWWPLGAAVVLAALGLLPALLGEPTAGRALPGLRLAAAALGAAVCFALPDRMATTVLTPTPRWLRQWLRLTLTLLPAGLVWALLLLSTIAAGADQVRGASGFLLLQVAVCGLLPVAAAAVAVRRRNTVTAALAGPVTQGVALVGTLFFAGARSPWPPPATGTWSAAQCSWLAVLVPTVAVLLAANRDVRP